MAGLEVCIVGLRRGQSLLGLNGHERVCVDLAIHSVRPLDFAGIYIPEVARRIISAPIRG